VIAVDQSDGGGDATVACSGGGHAVDVAVDLARYPRVAATTTGAAVARSTTRFRETLTGASLPCFGLIAIPLTRLQKLLEPWVTWKPCEDEEAAEALARLASEDPEYFADASLVSARWAELPFYATHRLIELSFARDHGPEHAFALHGPDDTRWLEGDSDPIHETNAAESLALTDTTVHDYVRFFFYFVRGDSGAFILIETPSEITVIENGAGSFDQDGSASDVELALRNRCERLRSRVVPLSTRTIDENGRWVIDSSVAFLGMFFAVTLAVPPDGKLDMTDDEPVDTLDHLSVPEYSSLELEVNPGALPESEGDEESGQPNRMSGVRVVRGLPARVSGEPVELPPDRDVTEAIVAVLLEDAIRERDSNTVDRSTLLRHFNAETRRDKPIDRLARLMSNSVPVIIIESDIPFVEDFVAGLIDGPNQGVSGGAVVRASVVEGDELRCRVDYENTATKLHLLSFHTYRGLFDAERTAHELALRDAAVLVGCERSAEVPEPLRRIADLVLTFPRIDRGRFARIFERVFQAKPTAGWDAPGADWTRYLVPADFHTPRRLSMKPDQALVFLKERVEARLKQLTPDIGPRLSELHGLGEARQICEDLIADIHAAQAGQIPWTAVDKGLLMIGAPGTGKTTLARALAKECGIKFVVASAAKWQSAGALDAHLLAMRADFTDARRYAPAILFLDEIDSIGSREQLGGDRNVVYQTEVINALLEQIQGINIVDPVIVIGATNYPEKVDPALRRAGRLDQVVQLPLPNIAGLEQIFDYYLKPYRAADEVARGIKTRALAELSFGLTGADVEFFVRGAARRARRARRKIKQEDLVAEITRRPRRPDSAPRLGPEEMRRVAVHEAGHTVARLVSSTQGDDLTFVTIIPRMDGSLGFVATVPRDGHVETRRTMLERLETVLAGRAAEEVIYGAEDVESERAARARTATWRSRRGWQR
jgi:AAA+ superfamily predicted ATPase